MEIKDLDGKVLFQNDAMKTMKDLVEKALANGVSCERASLVGADLTGLRSGLHATFNFAGANLTRAQFSVAELRAVNFTNANLTTANFFSAKLGASNFAGANLTGANFLKADATNCDFTGANMLGVDTAGANMTGAKI